MSSFGNIDKTLRQALSDLALGYPMVLENQNFDPQGLVGDIWVEVYQLPGNVFSMMKEASGADENTGVFQVSILSKNINDGPKGVTSVADAIATEFYHGKTYNSFESVFIQNTERNRGRIDGGFYRVDVSITWSCYADRAFSRAFTFGFSGGFA